MDSSFSGHAAEDVPAAAAHVGEAGNSSSPQRTATVEHEVESSSKEHDVERLVEAAVARHMARSQEVMERKLDSLAKALHAHTSALRHVVSSHPRASSQPGQIRTRVVDAEEFNASSSLDSPARRTSPLAHGPTPAGPESDHVPALAAVGGESDDQPLSPMQKMKLAVKRMQEKRAEELKSNQHRNSGAFGAQAASISGSRASDTVRQGSVITGMGGSRTGGNVTGGSRFDGAASVAGGMSVRGGNRVGSLTGEQRRQQLGHQGGTFRRQRKRRGSITNLNLAAPAAAAIPDNAEVDPECSDDDAGLPLGPAAADAADAVADDGEVLEASDAKPISGPSPAAAAKTAHHAEDRRGVSETNPLVTTADVTFVTMAVLSIMIAVLQIHPRGGEFREGGALHLTIVGYNAVIAVFTIAWVISRFFLAKRNGDWEIVDDLSMIRRHYMRTWFAYDLLYALPIDFIFVGWQWEVYRWIQLRHFLRLVRIFNLGSSHNPLLSSRLWFRFMSFCFMMLLTAHLLGVFFWALEERYSYEESAYWAIATMTSIGYGDVVPTHFGSRVYVCFAMFFGVVMLSTMTAFATSFLANKDKLELEAESTKQMMYGMLEHYDVPWDVQKDVIAVVPAMIDKDNEQTFKEMTGQLPGFVGKKIEGYIRVKMLRVVPMFKRISDVDKLLALGALLSPQYYPPGEPIIEQGTDDRDMFFLVRGVVEVIISKPSDVDPEVYDAHVVAVLQPGAFFGEKNLLQGGERGATVRAVSLCEALMLSQPDFEDYMEEHEDVQALFADEFKERVQTIVRQNSRLPGSPTTEQISTTGKNFLSAVEALSRKSSKMGAGSGSDANPQGSPPRTSSVFSAGGQSANRNDSGGALAPFTSLHHPPQDNS